MGRPPCCDKSNVKRGLWSAEEDAKILAYVSNHGIGNWTLVPKKAGLNRCGKSCRLRWTNYLRPDLKHDSFTPQEEELIINLHKAIGSRWSAIAKQLPGRTDNDVKNYWNTKLRKKLSKMGIDPVTHKPFSQILSDYGNIRGLQTTGNQMGSSLSKTLSTITTSLLSKPELSNAKIILKPMTEQVQDNHNNNPSWEFLSQFQVTNPDTMQLHFLNNAISSCSSSSPSALTQLSSPQTSYTCQPTQAQIVHSDPCSWSEFLLGEPILAADLQHEEYDLNGRFSGEDNQHVDRDGHGGTFSRGQEHGASDGKQENQPCQGNPSASASSFVDAILDRDTEMRSQFPQLLDGSFDY